VEKPNVTRSAVMRNRHIIKIVLAAMLAAAASVIAAAQNAAPSEIPLARARRLRLDQVAAW
jgi:hypothetical protein